MTRSTQQLFDLSGKTALITGAADGLGRQIAHALGEAGARIMLSAHRADELEAAMTELNDAGIDARWTVADCAVEKDLERLVTETLHRMGDVDILINNAGANWGVLAQDRPVDAWDKVMALNVRSFFLLSQLVTSQSMIGRGGHIVNLAPIAGQGGDAASLAYNTNLGAVINLTRSLARELGPHSINVNAVCSGPFANNMAGQGRSSLAAAAPLARLGDYEDLKGAILLFASDAGKYITGQWLAVDGGASAGMTGA